MKEYDKYKLLTDAEKYSKNKMNITAKKKKEKFGCLGTMIIVSVILILFYMFIIYYRHILFVELGL